MLGVLQEAACQTGVERIGPRHRRREIVDHQVLGHTLEEAQAASNPWGTSTSF